MRYTVDVKIKAPLLNTMIKKWIKINKTDYLLFGNTDKPLISSQLTAMNNKIWNGKKVSTDMYRHVFLTNFYSGTMPTLVEMDQVSKSMGTSVNTSMLYIKHD